MSKQSAKPSDFSSLGSSGKNMSQLKVCWRSATSRMSRHHQTKIWSCLLVLLRTHIYTDASDLQLGAVIMQNNRPVAYFSRKLNPGQQKYSTLEKELLSIFETFKEFQSMLLGANITVYTDHRNLTFPSSVNQRVLRQLSFCEQFHPTYRHIPGEKNFLADMFSRLPICEEFNKGNSSSDSAITPLQAISFRLIVGSQHVCTIIWTTRKSSNVF